jgi:hypothetical protein
MRRRINRTFSDVSKFFSPAISARGARRKEVRRNGGSAARLSLFLDLFVDKKRAKQNERRRKCLLSSATPLPHESARARGRLHMGSGAADMSASAGKVMAGRGKRGRALPSGHNLPSARYNIYIYAGPQNPLPIQVLRQRADGVKAGTAPVERDSPHGLAGPVPPSA